MSENEETKLYFEKPETDRLFVSKFQNPVHLLGKGARFELRKKKTEDLGLVDGITKEEQDKETEEVKKKYEKRRRRKARWVPKREPSQQQDWFFEAHPKRGESKKYLGRIEHKNEHNPYCLIVKDETGFTAYPLQDNWYEFKPLLDHQKLDLLKEGKGLQKRRKKVDEMWENAPISKKLTVNKEERRKEQMKQKKLEMEEEIDQKEGELDFEEIVDTDVGTFDKENEMDISHDITFERPQEFDEFDYMKEMYVEDDDNTLEERDTKDNVESLLKKRKRKKGDYDDEDEEEDDEPANKKRKLDNFGGGSENSPMDDDDEEKQSEEEIQYNKLKTKIVAYLIERNEKVPIRELLGYLGYLNIVTKKNMSDEEKMKYRNFIAVLKEFTKREKIGNKTYVSIKEAQGN